MRSRARHAVLVTLAVAVLSPLAACGDGDDATTTTSSSSPPATGAQPTTSTAPSTTTTVAGRVIEVVFSGGQVQTASQQVEVGLGDTVVIRATSDVAEEVHVHTYDRSVHLSPGVAGEVSFTADIPGRHEVEFENSHRRIITLVVR